MSHHNNIEWRKYMEEIKPLRKGLPYPPDMEDTGDSFCRLCEHKRSAVDGENVCLVCVLYITSKPDNPPEVVVFGPE